MLVVLVFDENKREKARADRHLFFLGVSELMASKLDEEAVQRGSVAIRLIELLAISGSIPQESAILRLGMSRVDGKDIIQHEPLIG